MIALLLVLSCAAADVGDGDDVDASEDAWQLDPTDVVPPTPPPPKKPAPRTTTTTAEDWGERRDHREDGPSPSMVVGFFAGGATVAGTAVALAVSLVNVGSEVGLYALVVGAVGVPVFTVVVAASVGALVGVGFEAGVGSAVGVVVGVVAGLAVGGSIGAGFEYLANSGCPGCSSPGSIAFPAAIVGIPIGAALGAPIGALIGARLGE